MHNQTCTCDTCNKARGCTVTLYMAGQSPVYDVYSPTSGKSYKVTFNTGGNVTCNCQCGGRVKKNPPCAHTRAARWHRELVPA